MRADRLLALIERDREAFAAERAEWQEERKLLLNAALSQTQSEFVVRQQAAKAAPPAPIAALPPEAHEAKPRALGL
jgi:hypothetical protein